MFIQGIGGIVIGISVLLFIGYWINENAKVISRNANHSNDIENRINRLEERINEIAKKSKK